MKKLVNYFVPERFLADAELYRKSRFSILVLYVLLLITIGVFLYTYTIRPDDLANIIIGFLFPTLILFCLWLFKRTGSFIALTHIVCCFSLLGISGAPLMTGGIYSPDTPTLYIIPVFAVVIGTIRIGLFYAALVMLVFVIYYFLAIYNVMPFRKTLETVEPAYFLMNLAVNAFVILFMLFRNERLRLQLVGDIRGVNKVISEKNKEITDSINYARRIQQAQLPMMEEIYAALPQSFVLYKPKDIISGDFYFFHQKDQLIFLAAADCTGHGVPGALMSMISGEKLHDAVVTSSDPNAILQAVNKGIKASLKQSDNDESTRDGMDIALCVLDIKKGTLQYAGANRPLWLVRNGDTAIEEIKATKKAIGGLTDDGQHFETRTLQITAGDTFYIFSDGYADTFSGQDSKKLTTKKFKEILLSIREKSMEQQGQHLDQFIEKWKGGTEQVDDILVIGVRV